MICRVCGCDAVNPQWFWVVDVDSKSASKVVVGVIVACKGPECAGSVIHRMDRLCDEVRTHGKRWLLMDWSASKKTETRLLANYNWSGENITAPKYEAPTEAQ